VSEPEFCIANINAAGRRRRLALGVVVLAASVGANLPLAGLWGGLGRLLELPPVFFGWLCVLQALENT